MNKFYFFLWLKWSIRLTISSIVLASILSFVITLVIYFNQGMASLNTEVFYALIDVFKFWFPISWSFTLLISLFRSLKHIFNSCINGYELKLLECFSTLEKGAIPQVIDYIGYGDIVKVWRKWFMLIIWLVGSQMILALFFTYMFTSYAGIFDWFNIYWLYSFIIIGGYFSFIVLSLKCKRVKVVKC